MKALIVAAAVTAAACQPAASPLGKVTKEALAPSAPMAAVYDTAPSDADYRARVDAAIKSLAPGHKALIVFGANWCHDSKALAGWLRDPRFTDVLAKGLEPVFVDVGKPQDGHGRNLGLVRRFGIENLKSTPAMVVVDGDGRRLNTPEDAIAWRNAAGRKEADIRAELLRYAAIAPLGEKAV